MKAKCGLLALCTAIFLGCASGGGGGVQGNEGGSEPSNEKEAVAYKKALLKCYKTGGHRIVKIEGQLRCY